MTHTVDRRDEGAVVALRGHVMGGPDGTQLRDTLRRLKAEQVARVVVDLSDVTRINPMGLGVLVGGLALMRNQGGELYFANVPNHVQSLLVITRLAAAVPCFDSVEAALRTDADERSGPSGGGSSTGRSSTE